MGLPTVYCYLCYLTGEGNFQSKVSFTTDIFKTSFSTKKLYFCFQLFTY